MSKLQYRLCEMSTLYEHRDDVLNMALVLFAERFLFGSNYKKKIYPWLFTLADDMEQFNSFSWVKFVFHYLNVGIWPPSPGKNEVCWHFYGFSIVLQVDYHSYLVSDLVP